MMPADVQLGIYINYGIENSEKDPKFKAGDYVWIWKCKNLLAIGRESLFNQRNKRLSAKDICY